MYIPPLLKKLRYENKEWKIINFSIENAFFTRLVGNNGVAQSG